ncbi:hypothetical protein [Stigmatella aurantiaca]|uniref:Uncharacterized protein n=1 Tax=Stigmatella aurantiaca (strain DW4/3-1) TaxID=378806 RepID=E3FK95_STIAD|nr:hypothetical protein [Stigmatella aurantiaca]ADO75464.1 uncharacterized protein STAUR_7709 [Stigmatella aurantiaca DW4/3-1]
MTKTTLKPSSIGPARAALKEANLAYTQAYPGESSRHPARCVPRSQGTRPPTGVPWSRAVRYASTLRRPPHSSSTGLWLKAMVEVKAAERVLKQFWQSVTRWL